MGENSTAVATHLDDDRASVLAAIRTQALHREGSFLLASGRRSDYFLDMKTVLNDGTILERIARMILSKIPREATAVGGLAMGAIPISTAIVILCTRAQPPRRIRAFWVRREEKTHGLGGVVSGTLEPADRVVIVDDVTTTGKSVLQAIDAVLAKGVKVLKVVSVVDRLEGARETIEKRGIKFESLYTRDEVLGE